MTRSATRRTAILEIFSLLLIIVLPIFLSERAQAANPNLTFAMVRLDRMLAGTATTGTICVRPTSTAAENKVMVTFPATGSWTVGVSANWAVSTTNIGWPTTGTVSAWTGVTAGVASGQTVTFTGGGDMTVGTMYCFNWTNTAALTTGTAGDNQVGYVETQTSTPTTIDKSAVAFSTYTNDTISVTGAVNPTFSFALPTNTATFASPLVNTATVETNASVATITTNARAGWITWVKSANAALTSASPGATPIATVGTYDGTPSTLSGGAPGYVLKVTTTGATAAPNAEYVSGTDQGGTLTTAFNIAASGTAAASGDTVSFIERARVSATQPPANDYTDTLTIVAAGQF